LVKPKVAAIVVFFRPKPADLINLRKFANLEKTLIVDNSEEEWEASAELPDNYSYRWLGGNLGIGHALNVGCSEAFEAGYDFALTMDQDSSFDSDSLAHHLSSAESIFRDDCVAIIAANYGYLNSTSPTGVIERASVITSGNLLRLTAWKKVGGFREDYFIDQVDHEFCYKLRHNGYKVVLNRDVAFHHEVGEPVSFKILGWRIVSSNHSAERRYYQMRNSLFLREDYPQYAKKTRLYLFDLIVTMLGILIAEPARFSKFFAIFVGFRHYRKRKHGKWAGL